MAPLAIASMILQGTLGVAVVVLTAMALWLWVRQPWYQYLAFKYAFPSGRPVSLFFLMSAFGVALGVMMMIIVMSIMGGLGQRYRDLMVKTNGHLLVVAESSQGLNIRDFVPEAERLVETIRQWPEVEAVTPLNSGAVMLVRGSRTAFPLIRGVDPVEGLRVLPLEEFIVVGDSTALDDETVLLSEDLAQNLGVFSRGQTVEVYTPYMLERMRDDEVILARELTVGGVFRTNWRDFDGNAMITTVRLQQELFGLEPDQIMLLSVRLRGEGANEAAIAERIATASGGAARALSWEEMNANFLWVLQFERNMIFFMLLFISIVSAFVIAVAQFLTVLRKTREIGLLNALGGRPWQVLLGFGAQGYAIGLVGCGLGTVLALTVLHYRDGILDLIAKLTGSQVTVGQFYQFDTSMPIRYAVEDFTLILGSALVLAFLAGFFPALRAASLRPAEALRSDG